MLSVSNFWIGLRSDDWNDDTPPLTWSDGERLVYTNWAESRLNALRFTLCRILTHHLVVIEWVNSYE